MDELTAWWARERWPLFQAIERERANLESILTLSRLLGCEIDAAVTQRWQRDIETARHHFAVIDDALPATRADALASAICLWLVLDVQFCPDERSRLLNLKIALIRIAEQQEIDLRGMGV